MTDLAALAARLRLPPPGPVPHALPDSWLASLDAVAATIAAAEDEAQYRLLTGEPAPDAPLYKRLARAHVYTDALEAALRAELPRAEGPRRRLLTLWLRHAVTLRLDADPEVHALTAGIEAVLWPALAAPAADQPALAARIEPDLLRLVRRRNALARAEGWADFGKLVYDRHEAPQDAMFALLDRVAAATAGPQRRLVAWLAEQEGAPVRTFTEMQRAMRRHVMLPDERLPAVDAAALARATAALGLPAWGLPHHLTLQPFGTGGLCSAIDAIDDVRIVVSTGMSRVGQHGTLLHEFGHAYHASAMARAGLPHHARVLLSEPGPLCETMSQILESVVFDRAWTAAVVDADAATLDAWALRSKRSLLRIMGVHMRNAAFERALYADPDQDVAALSRRIDREVLGLDPPAESAALWSLDPLLTSFPLYGFTFAVSFLAVYQLREALGGELWGNPDVGPFLARHFWEPGAMVPWTERVERATGAPLSPDALLRWLAPVLEEA